MKAYVKPTICDQKKGLTVKRIRVCVLRSAKRILYRITFY